uniref:Putative hemerythrin-like protein n=1 Tax=Talaromyces marneffei PM1 TaxID=1077442 RepID=A0A093XBY5_TALMA
MASAASGSSATRTPSISDTIKHDHVALRNGYNKILGTTDLDERRRWQNQFTWDLARHAVGEELVVYPALEKVVADGKRIADRDREDHHIVKKYLYKFQALNPTDTEFEPTLRNLWGDLSAHIRKEEEEDLIQLEDGLTQQDSANLTSSFERTKMFVPTRSHPMAPDKPPFETVAGLMAAPMDKLADIFRRFPEEASYVDPLL